MDNKIIYVDFKKASKKSKRYLKGNNTKYSNYKSSYFIRIFDKIKSLFSYCHNNRCKSRERVSYKHWL